jgi:hypothetical protein
MLRSATLVPAQDPDVLLLDQPRHRPGRRRRRIEDPLHATQEGRQTAANSPWSFPRRVYWWRQAGGRGRRGRDGGDLDPRSCRLCEGRHGGMIPKLKCVLCGCRGMIPKLLLDILPFKNMNVFRRVSVCIFTYFSLYLLYVNIETTYNTPSASKHTCRRFNEAI